MVRNPVMFVVLVGAAGSTMVAVDDPTVFAWADHGVAVAHGGLCEPG